jgi:flagellin FlaB
MSVLNIWRFKLKNNIFGKFAKAVAIMRREQRGMTGLETAIILIAFVTVAAVFGYAVLSAGLFSAERGKETIYAGLQQAKANMEVSGSVIVQSNTLKTAADNITFTVRNAIAGAPIDMTAPGGAGLNRCVISLTTADVYYNNVEWSKVDIGASDNDALLEAGEQMEVTVKLNGIKTADNVTLTNPNIGVNDWFNLQVKPTQGSTMTLQRTLPAGLDTIMDMH